jgi:probable F420-dependent oxidoreductase
MKFGVSIFPTHYSAGPAEVAAEAERLGFESFWVSEHSHIPVDTEFPFADEVPDDYRSMFDPFVSLGAAAAVTDQLRLGTSICLVTQHDPINCAKAVATIDQISAGRFEFGIGAGWNPPEMENHGVAFANRFKMTRERLEAMKRFWTQDEAEYHGDLVDITRSWMWPKPVQSPYPPVLIAGAGPNILKRVISQGDGWMPFVVSSWNQSMHHRMTSLGQFAEQVRELRRMSAELGLPRKTISVKGLAAVPSDIDAMEALEIDRMILPLPQAGRDEVFEVLDSHARAVANYAREGAA